MIEVKLFYSWQSDRRNKTILVALGKAKETLRTKDIDLKIEMATSEMTGSPDIMQAIYNKIDACDFMVSDITIVSTNEKQDKGYCNSNVMLELGYASCKIGIDRIITLFNSLSGEPNILPFDIRNHRFTPFKNDVKKETTNADLIASIVVSTIETFKNNNNLKKPLVPKEFLQMEITNFYVYKKELLINFSKTKTLARKINNEFDYMKKESLLCNIPEFDKEYDATINLFNAFKKDLGKNVNFESTIESYQNYVDKLAAFKAMVDTALEYFGPYDYLKPMKGGEVKNAFDGCFNDLEFAFRDI